VAAMVEIARAVDARIVAEMVETEEQAALMAELGVSFGQGWLFGRPGALPGRRR
jgi:EAL domain-containing protein (putative c-di-GMP-specific phosphodiesterase class I)